MKPNIPHFLLFIIVLMGSLRSLPAAAADEDQTEKIPKDLQETLRESSNNLSPLTVEWRSAMTALLPMDQVLSKFNIGASEAKILLEPITEKAIIQGRKLYEGGQRGSGETTEAWEHSFDGETLFMGRPNDKGPGGHIAASLSKLNVRRVASEDPVSRWILGTYPRIMGFWLPTYASDFLDAKGPIPNVLKQIADGGTVSSIQETSIAGKKLLRVEIKGFDPDYVTANKIDVAAVEKRMRAAEVPVERMQEAIRVIEEKRNSKPWKYFVSYFDPQRAYVLVQYEEQDFQRLLELRQVNDQFQKIKNVWIPMHSRIEYFTWYSTASKPSGDPVMAQEFHVIRCLTEPVDDKTFALNYTAPGTLILETPLNGPKVTHQVVANATDLAKAFGERPVSREGAYWWVFVLTGVLVLLVTGILWWVGVFRGHKTKGGST